MDRAPFQRRFILSPLLEIMKVIQRQLPAVYTAQLTLNVALEVPHAHAQRGGSVVLAQQDRVRGRR